MVRWLWNGINDRQSVLIRFPEVVTLPAYLMHPMLVFEANALTLPTPLLDVLAGAIRGATASCLNYGMSGKGTL